MGNSIGFGNINSYWGIGVSTNTISWGKSYADIAGGINLVTQRFADRVEAAGGTVESLECIKIIK